MAAHKLANPSKGGDAKPPVFTLFAFGAQRKIAGLPHSVRARTDRVLMVVSACAFSHASRDRLIAPKDAR